MSNILRVACGQLCSSSNLQHNATVVKKLIMRAVQSRVEVLFLPEACDYIAKDAKESMLLALESHQSFIAAIQEELKNVCLKNKHELYVAVGVHEPSHSISQSEKLSRVQNNQLWISPQGKILQRYQKLHLFDINIENGPILKESNSVEPGHAVLNPFPVNEENLLKFKIGFGICYDIRFPELCLRLRKLGANIITYPSAFTTKTGVDHWQALGKARALDSQCFVIMAAQCGEHKTDSNKKRVSYGNSVIFDPWGNVMAQCLKFDDDLELDNEGDYYEMCIADIDMLVAERVRRDMPLMEHRRPDVFGYDV